MRLTRLELIGFKSFAKRTELSFGNGITAVIGPNGSGKSNIADAVRWVLGEQSAKTLRGSKMEDVIFNGTQQRKSLGYCEVNLVFDNSDGKLNIAFTEVEISRRLYRNGESEYRINGNSCRLKDIQELFRDTGIGKDGYSIISQGKVDEILSNKSNDRRVALEEAAGIMHYRVRKEEAERKLENTEKNLIRLEDIISELSARLGPLEEQSAVARQYLKLHDELKDLEVNQFLYQYDKSNDKLRNNEEFLKNLSDQENELITSSDALLNRISELERQNIDMEAEMNSHQNNLMNVMSALETAKGERKVLLERKERILSDIVRINSERNASAARREKILEDLQNIEIDTEKSVVIRNLDEEIGKAEEQILSRDEELKSAETELEQLKNDIMEAMNRIADTKSDLSRLDAMTNAIDARKIQLLEEKDQCILAGEILNKELNKAGVELDEINQNCCRLGHDLDESKQSLSGIESEYQTLLEQMHTVEQEINQNESRERVLREMISSHEGYINSVRLLLHDAESQPELKNRIIGVVAELIHVPKEYEVAVNMSLGASLQNIVTETSDDAQAAVDYLRLKDYGRATFLPLSLIRSKPVTTEEKKLIESDGCIGLASDLVGCEPDISPVVQYLLGRTLIVENLTSGIAMKKKTSGAFQIATLEGDIISTGGSISGGSIKKQDTSLLGREREVKELALFLKEKKKIYDSISTEVDQTKTKILQMNIQVESFQNELKEQEILQAKGSETFDIIKRDIENNNGRIAKIDNELSALMENVSEISGKKNDSLLMQEKLTNDNITTQEDITSAQKRLLEMRQRRDAALNAIAEQKVRLVSLQKEQASADSERNRFNQEASELFNKITEFDTELRELNEQIKLVDYQINQTDHNSKEQEAEANSQKELQKQMEEKRIALLTELAAGRTKRDDIQNDIREVSEKKHRTELASSRIEMELSAMQERIWDEYELTYDNALLLRHEFAVGASGQRIHEIKALIHDMGEVNVASIEDYKSVSERYEDLTTQRNDLRNAKNDLEKIIMDLTSTMKDVFIKQFTEIQKNFNEVFHELFGGGYAELRLSDKEDILGCDIDIIAQPPGKKLQLLSLLSGGERALTAIALLFAMLKIKPPAFCVLDEIESSLDEANVSRFAQYLKDYSDDTQFIIITHRKGSMEVCDSLYGVSMEERGVSKIVSARFEEVTA